MFLLLETMIAFAAIMLLLSYLVKSLTSVVKNHVQYYGQNLQLEVRRLVSSLSDKAIGRLEDVKDNKGNHPFRGIDWRHFGEEFLTEENMKKLLGRFDFDLDDLEKRLAQHRKSLAHGFERRMKNLSLACGLGLCLLFNINALTIWNELYENAEVRAKFASQEFVDATLEELDETKEEEGRLKELGALPARIQEIEAKLADDSLDAADREQLEGELGAKRQELAALQKDTGVETPEDREKALARLAEERRQYQGELDSFLDEVDFGIARVWEQGRGAGPAFYLFEFLASLLTGILASVGAPYWHDLLRTLTALRKKREAAVP